MMLSKLDSIQRVQLEQIIIDRLMLTETFG